MEAMTMGGLGSLSLGVLSASSATFALPRGLFPSPTPTLRTGTRTGVSPP